MTKQEWKQRCTERILREVKKAGRIRLRGLKRSTHYNRGPRDDEGMGLSLEIWWDALEHLERVKAIVFELDDYGNPVWIMTPAAEVLRECVARG
jgi:hypothetical protein